MALPDKVTTPIPGNTTTNISTIQAIYWKDDTDPLVTYDVYFGTDSTPDSSEFQGNQTSFFFTPGVMATSTTYYWRVDARNAEGVTTGDIWSFTTAAVPTTLPGDETRTRKLVAACNNGIFYEDSSIPAKLTQLTGMTVDTSLPISLFEAFQKIFVVNDTAFQVIDFVNSKITVAAKAIKDPGINDLPAHNEIIGQGASRMIVDFIEFDSSAETIDIYGLVTTGTFETSTTLSVLDSSMTLTTSAIPTAISMWNLENPLYYTWQPYPDLDLGSASQFGAMPDRVTIGSLYRGRAALSGDKYYPHQWYLARQDNPWDWGYVAGDAQSPVAGNNTDMGQIGDVVKAQIPYSDDYMIYGCEQSMWIMRGVPMIGGTIGPISLTEGIFGKDAWCWDDQNNIYFLGTSGLCKIGLDLSRVENLTVEVIPRFMRDLDLDATLHRVTLTYSRKHRGVLLNKVVIVDEAVENYWIDLRTFGIFPLTFPQKCGVFSTHYYQAGSEDYRQIMMGCYDGYVRFFDRDMKSDDIGVDPDGLQDTQAINSFVCIGPFKLSDSETTEGKLLSLTITTGGGAPGGTQPDTDSLDYQIFTGDTAEKVIERMTQVTFTPDYAGTLSIPGKSKRIRQRVKGVYAGLRLFNNNINETWSFEIADGISEISGWKK